MNKYKVLALRWLDFKTDDGSIVKGYQLWCLGETVDPGWKTGFEVVKLWFPHDHALVPFIQELRTNATIQVRFNRRGKPDLIEIAE